MVKDLHLGYRTCFSNDAGDFFEAGKTNGKIVFSAYTDFISPTDTNNANLELFVSDGTDAGTQLLKEINPNGTSYLNGFYTFNNKVYFYANDGTTEGMWVTDGTFAGTNLVKNIRFRAYYNNLQRPNVIDLDATHFIFAADSTPSITNLYISDGTTAGTMVLKNFNPGGVISNAQPGHFTKVANNKIVFTAKTATVGEELWVTDGTPQGTSLLMNINPGTADFLTWNDGFTNFHSDGQRAYFFANDGIHGAELWTSDGTPAGTMMVKDINPGLGKSMKSLTGFVTANGFTYFIANTPTTGTELYKTDGTDTGTTLVADFRPGAEGGVAEYLALVNNKIIFAGTSDGLAVNVYAHDPIAGTATTLINFYVNPVSTPSDPFGPTLLSENVFCNKLYFNYFYNGSTLGSQIGVTDGSVTGTGVVLDSLPNPSNALCKIAYWGTSFVELNNALLYRGNDLVHGWELTSLPLCTGPNTIVTTGLDKINIDNNLAIYPNPSNGNINIKMATQEGRTELKMFDAAGNQVYGGVIIGNQSTLETNLAPGFYFMHFRNENNLTIKKVVITQ